MKTGNKAVSLFSLAGPVLAVIFAFWCIMTGLGNRWGLWNFRTALLFLRWAAYFELASVVISLTGLITGLLMKSGRAVLLSALGLLIGAAAVSVPLSMWMTARSVPPIHDISTDTGTPPQFVMILNLRKDSPNAVEYGGPELAAKQHGAYPDIAPMIIDGTPENAFEQALTAARKMGWEIVNADPKAGLIEATDTTFWFGFKDDIVIRVAPDNGRSRIDVRSVSRVGKSDVGANAERIRKYLRKFREVEQTQRDTLH